MTAILFILVIFWQSSPIYLFFGGATAILFILVIFWQWMTLDFFFWFLHIKPPQAWFEYDKNKINIWYKIVKILIILKRNLHTVYIYTICEIVKN